MASAQNNGFSRLGGEAAAP